MREMNRQERTTFIFSTHDANILQYAKRVTKLKDGVIAAN
jgi:putative ABC transport system ATP-binding protein